MEVMEVSMINSTRRCEVHEKVYDKEVKNWVTKKYDADWHIFGQATEEDKNGNIQYMVAIVELDDGTIRQVDAEDIKFIDKGDSNE